MWRIPWFPSENDLQTVVFTSMLVSVSSKIFKGRKVLSHHFSRIATTVIGSRFGSQFFFESRTVSQLVNRSFPPISYTPKSFCFSTEFDVSMNWGPLLGGFILHCLQIPHHNRVWAACYKSFRVWSCSQSVFAPEKISLFEFLGDSWYIIILIRNHRIFP